MSGLITISELRRVTGKPAHVINHAIDRHGPAPAGRIGIARVWRAEDLPRILESIRKTTGRAHRAETVSELG